MLRSSRTLLAIALAGAPACQAISAALSTDLPLKAGNTIDGEQVGTWRYYHAGPDGKRDGLSAKGYYEKDKPDDRWTYYWPRTDAQRAAKSDGNPRWEVGFERHGYSGPTTFYHDNGSVLAQGAFEEGLETGTWSFFEADGTLVQEGNFARGRRTGLWRYWDGEGHPVAEGARDEARRVGRWRFWLSDGSTYDVDFTQPAADGTQPSEGLLATLDKRPPIPILPQPGLTMLEEELRDYFVEMYTVGRDKAHMPATATFAQASATYGPGKAGKRKFQDELKSKELQGRELPRRYLADPQGASLDLIEAGTRGHWTVLVILRGQKDAVCVYCMAQTESLAQTQLDFESRGAEITVVYPGAIERFESFREAYEREFGQADAELRFAYDEDFALVDGLDIRHEFAWPTTLLVDPGGVIRYAYVGRAIDDRPSAEDILKKLDELKGAS